ncbi:MAG TPA: DeoR/GlpR family DNA-binding transcription regulator [Candidatus Lustribacter sp.]|nr:DeoR/GlpR family DNA-binding transcription regulator [Candidatus Lustribacter sp.]
MLASQRRDVILGHVQAGGARVSALVELLGVSDMTIRRDIEHLVTQGLVHKVHGGALPTGAMSAVEPGFIIKSELQVAHKQAIARAAAALVKPGSAIGISAGTTTYQVARELRAVPNLTIVTNSMLIAQVLQDGVEIGQTVILTGGTRTPSDALVGPVAVDALHGLHVDLLFLGVHGMTIQTGLTTPNIVEAETNRALVAAATRTVVTADHSKWGVIGLASFGRLELVERLVTDSGLPGPAREAIEALGCRVDLVDLLEDPARLDGAGSRSRPSHHG